MRELVGKILLWFINEEFVTRAEYNKVVSILIDNFKQSSDNLERIAKMVESQPEEEELVPIRRGHISWLQRRAQLEHQEQQRSANREASELIAEREKYWSAREDKVK